MRVLLFLLLLACTGRAFDTVYVPDQHAAIVTIQCDDNVSPQFVDVCVEHGVTMDFAPYEYSGRIPIDSSLVKGQAWAIQEIQKARNKGMTFSAHWTVQAPRILLVADSLYGTQALARDSLIACWDVENDWLATVGAKGREAQRGFVYVGHVNSPETRAMASEYGYSFTRGNLSDSKDLYLPSSGWVNMSGASGFPPLAMQHKALVPSCSMYRLTTSGAVDSLYQLSTAADTTHLWRGTLNFLNTLASNNAHAVWNVHPPWTGVHADTEADTIAAVWVQIPDTYAATADSILFSKRRGSTDRNDLSAYQLDYVLKAAKYWSDSTAAVDGVTRLCITNINDLIASTKTNMRTDNSSDPDAVADTFPDSTNARWAADGGLYTKDPALDRSHPIYIDGTGTVKAGNGTAAYPLPRACWNRVFNCHATMVGHTAGDTLEITSGTQFRPGAIDLDFAGMTLMSSDSSATMMNIGVPGTNTYYNHSTTLRNAILDGGATSGTNPIINVGIGSGAQADSTRAIGITFKGLRFRNGEKLLTITNTKGVVVDSCYFHPEGGRLSNNGANICIQNGTRTNNLLIRNSFFDMDSSGNASTAIYLFNASEDSCRILNNVFRFGNVFDTDDHHYVIRTNADSTVAGSKSIRLSGVYLDRNGIAPADTIFWRSDHGAQALGRTRFNDWVTRGSAAFTGTKQYETSGYGYSVFNPATTPSDTTRFGGYTGTGSIQTGSYASIGPSVYGYAPLLWTSGAVQGRPSTATLQGPWEALSLVNNGVLTTSSATDPDTWFEIPRIYDESSLAVARSFLDAWEAWPAANQAKVRFKVSGEPVTVITSADSTYQTLGQLVNALAGNVAAETAADSLTASTWFSLPRPYNLNAAFQIEIARAWWRVLPDTSKVKIRFRVAGTDYSMSDTDSTYSQGLWGLLADIGTGATASDSLDAATWFMLPRVYDMAQAQQAGIYRDAWAGWPLATQKKIRLKTK